MAFGVENGKTRLQSSLMLYFYDITLSVRYQTFGI